MTKFLTSIGALLAIMLLGSCGNKPAQLTPEQEKAVSSLESSFSSYKAKAEAAVEDLKKSASTSPEVKKAQEDIATSMGSAQAAVKSLREETGKAFDQKKADVEAAIKDLTDKTAAAAKTKLGGILPKI